MLNAALEPNFQIGDIIKVGAGAKKCKKGKITGLPAANKYTIQPIDRSKSFNIFRLVLGTHNVVLVAPVVGRRSLCLELTGRRRRRRKMQMLLEESWLL